MDQKLLFLVNDQWTSPGLDSFMATLSCFPAWLPVIILIVLLTWILGGFKARAMLVCLGIIIAFMDVVVSDTLKDFVGRARPREALADVRMVDLQPGTIRTLSIFKPPVVVPSPPAPDHPHGHSFPSGHTINNFSAATVLTLFYRKRGWLYFIPAALVGYSRIYVGAHWPSDVLISSIMGVVITFVLMILIEWAWQRLAPRWFPALFAQHPNLTGRAAA